MLFAHWYTRFLSLCLILYEPYLLTFRELHICEQVLWPNGTYNDSYLDNSTIAVTMDISSKFTVKVPYSGKHW